MTITEGGDLRAEELQGRCDRLPSREVTREEMLMCHTEEHVDLVEAASEVASAGLRLNQVGVYTCTLSFPQRQTASKTDARAPQLTKPLCYPSSHLTHARRDARDGIRFVY